MNVKVQCVCGTRFSFDVEPINERMPMPVVCPACGLDATTLANNVIRQQSAAATPSATLRVSKSAHAATPSQAAAQGDPSVPHCPRHPAEAAVDTCRVCGKPICEKCMEQFGHVCSVYCRQQAEQKKINVPVYSRQKSVTAGKARAVATLAVYAVLAIVVLVIGAWIWYAWFARNPKLAYSLPIPTRNIDPNKPAKPNEFYELIAPGELLAVKEKHVSLFDIREQRTLWSAALLTDAEIEAIKAARAKNDAIIKNTPRVLDPDSNADITRYTGLNSMGYEDDTYFASPRVIATSDDIWLAYSDYLARFDRHTGARKDLAIAGNILNVTTDDSGILVVSGSPGAQETLTEFSLPNGDAQSEDITRRAQMEIAASTNVIKQASAAKIKTVKADSREDSYPVSQLKDLANVLPGRKDTNEGAPEIFEGVHPFIAAGPNVAQLGIQLLERKTIVRATMKPKGQSVLGSGNLTASQSTEVAEEMANEHRREETGGVIQEDVSRYQVTIHRRFASGIPDWTGEVTGPPQFFPLKTVDVLAAGQTITVLSKDNKKLWDAKLTFNVPTHSDGDFLPCIETKDALYFADLGILTRFDLATGAVRWRFNSVGISHIQTDDSGALYLDSTTAGPDSIQYSQQVNLHDKINPLIIKLNSETGIPFWRLESVGDHCLLSGKFVYAYRNKNITVALRLEDGPDRHYYFKLLDPASGKDVWANPIHKVNETIFKTEVQKNWILMQLEDRVLVYKFFSF